MLVVHCVLHLIWSRQHNSQCVIGHVISFDVFTSSEASDRKAGVMTAAGLLQRKLNKGQSSFLLCMSLIVSLLVVDRPSGVPRAFKKTPRYVTARKTGDIVPPVPFCMKPTPHTLFIRQRLGGRSLIRAARHPNILITPKSSPKPSCELARQCTV